MKSCLAVLILTMSLSASAQTADAIYQRACGPKDASFDVQQIKGQPSAAPEPGKALVYFIQDAYGEMYTTRVGLDGAWVGAFKKSWYVSISVAPGEHHACVSWQNVKSRRPRFLDFTAEAGKSYYYLVHSITGQYSSDILEIGPVDHDEALFLIASDPQSAAKPKSNP
jgi:hypothetical protein